MRFSPPAFARGTSGFPSTTQLYQYNAKGELEYTALDADQDGQISFAGADQITRTVNDVVAAHDTYVRRTRVYEWPTIGQDKAILVSTSEQEVNGVRSWTLHLTRISTVATARVAPSEVAPVSGVRWQEGKGARRRFARTPS